MLIKTLTQRATQGDEDQGENRKCENDVRDQDEQIDGTKPRRLEKNCRAYLMRPEIKVVSQITRQKDRRGDEGRDHAVAVRLHVLAFDEHVTGCQKNRAE